MKFLLRSAPEGPGTSMGPQHEETGGLAEAEGRQVTGRMQRLAAVVSCGLGSAS